MARKNTSNSLAVRDNTPGGRSNANPSPSSQNTKHKTSHPNPMGAKTHSQGGVTLAVQGNANVRADGFTNPPVKNSSPATGRTYPPSNPPVGRT